LLYPFFILLFFFSLYTINTLNYNVAAELDSGCWKWTVFDWTNRVCVIVCIAYFLGMEVYQVILEPKEYLTSGWNLTDLLNYLLCMMVVILDLLPGSYDEEGVLISDSLFEMRRFFAALSSLLLWIKLFYFLRTFESTARLIRMIIEIINDMKNFLMVLVICIFGFTNGFYIIQQG
jgi:hypothetical protein